MKSVDLMLIYPPITVEERYAHNVGKRVGGDLPPLGIACLAAYVREKGGYTVDAVDSIGLNLGLDDLISRIEKVAPRVVGF